MQRLTKSFDIVSGQWLYPEQKWKRYTWIVCYLYAKWCTPVKHECSKTGLCIKVKALWMLSRGNTWKPCKCDRGQIFQLPNLNVHLNVNDLSKCVLIVKRNLRKRNFHQIGQAWNFITEISIGKSMCCCILVWEHYWSRNGRNSVLIGLLDFSK